MRLFINSPMQRAQISFFCCWILPLIYHIAIKATVPLISLQPTMAHVSQEADVFCHLSEKATTRSSSASTAEPLSKPNFIKIALIISPLRTSRKASVGRLAIIIPQVFLWRSRLRAQEYSTFAWVCLGQVPQRLVLSQKPRSPIWTRSTR